MAEEKKIKDEKTNETKQAKKSGSSKKVVIGIIAAVVVIAGIFVAIKMKKPAKMKDFESQVTTIDGIEIPEGTRIVALGEAAHGNKEFQSLKLEVFQELVEKTNVRALILEGDLGGCAIANKYIQGGEGTAEEATLHLGYTLYKTDEMCELVQWMHDYNETAAEDDKVRLYGMDIQYDEDTILYLEQFYQAVDEAKFNDYSDQMVSLMGEVSEDFQASNYDATVALMDDIKEDIEANKDSYTEKVGAAEVEFASYAAENLKYFASYRAKENCSNKARDTYMKTNVDWFLEVEEREHNGAVMIGCHNGHMTRNHSSVATFLGTFLAEEYGDKYFAIGTDAYYSVTSLPKTSARDRVDRKFCSDDPIAYQVKDMSEDKYYIDFSKVDANSDLGKKINSNIRTGSVGETDSIMYKFVKSTYTINFKPTDMYDAMIVYYDVEPIRVWTDK
ncbi:MAG: erythromycin esterase family protein [Eubacterium sp.]|nr:erythromycin esterase family protein [Eubacterium sp.]